MSPVLPCASPLIATRSEASVGPSTASSLQATWTNPSDILSLLLILGGDVIQRAVAQQAGDPYLPTPVVFSFGWVAYAFTAVLASVGENLLMPPAPDYPSVVLSTKHGYVRENHSWILGRLLRDYEGGWMPMAAKEKLKAMLHASGRNKAGLCISVFEAAEGREAGVPLRDIYWWSGYVVAALQLIVAAAAWAVLGDWETFLVVSVGTVLAFISGSLWQWRRERWCCRRQSRKTFVLMRGNGAQHAIVILGRGRGLDLEDLAGWTESSVASKSTKFINGGLLVCWIVLLLTVSGMKNDTWVLLAIGAAGMLHTIVVAGGSRRPEAFGLHLKFRESFVDRKVMKALSIAESKYPDVGRSMFPVFFPGGIAGEDPDWEVEAAEK